MLKNFAFVYLFIVITACKDAGTPETESIEKKDHLPGTEKNGQNNKDSAANGSVNDISGCYIRVLQKDSFVAHLQQNGKLVAGKLTFNNYQKDGSAGWVKGEMDGAITRLIYSFQSEGVNSVMEVYFKMADNNLIRGVGEMTVKNDTSYFPNPAAIQYPENDKMNRINCDRLPSEYHK